MPAPFALATAPALVCDPHALWAAILGTAAVCSAAICRALCRSTGGKGAAEKAAGAAAGSGGDRAPPSSPTASEGRFDGWWQSSRGERGENNAVEIIEGKRLTWHNGSESTLSWEGKDSFSVQLQDRVVCAQLEVSGGTKRLKWDDGDVWTRCNAEGAPGRMPPEATDKVICAQVKLSLDRGTSHSKCIALFGDTLFVLGRPPAGASAPQVSLQNLPDLAERSIELAGTKVNKGPEAMDIKVDGIPGGFAKTLKMKMASREEAVRWLRLLADASGEAEATQKKIECMARSLTPPQLPPSSFNRSPAMMRDAGFGGTWPPQGVTVSPIAAGAGERQITPRSRSNTAAASPGFAATAPVRGRTPPRGLSPRSATGRGRYDLRQELSQAEEQARALVEFFEHRQPMQQSTMPQLRVSSGTERLASPGRANGMQAGYGSPSATLATTSLERVLREATADPYGSATPQR